MDGGLVRIAGYSSEDEATATARELLLHGLGATVTGPDPSEGSDGHPYGVLVVREERLRAREILGLVDGREQELAEVDRARRAAPPLKVLVPLVLGAFLLIPVIAFYLTFKASGG